MFRPEVTVLHLNFQHLNNVLITRISSSVSNKAIYSFYSVYLMFYSRGGRPGESNDLGPMETALGYYCSPVKSPLLLGKASPPLQPIVAKGGSCGQQPAVNINH